MKRHSQTHRYQLESLEPRRLLTTYTVDLGTLGGATSSASDINASGQIVGTSSRADGNDRAFLWQNGVMTDLGTLGGHYSSAFAINDAGLVVGQTSTPSAYHAFLVTPEDTDSDGKPDRWYRDSNADGKNDLMRDLGTIGGNYVYAIANDVNNLGQVVGSVSTDGFHGSVSHAFRWQNGVMTDLGTFGGQTSFAYAINDAGQVAGTFYRSGLPGAFLWKNGVGVDLASRGISDINASGQFVGGAGMWTPTVANGLSGTFATLGQLPSVWQEYPEYVTIETVAQSINAAGQVAGTQQETFTSDTGNGFAQRGIRWINGVPQELPLETAAAINDAGQIVGTRARAVLLANENFPMPLLAISGATVTEGNSGTTNAVFTVGLSKASTQTVTVHYASTDGTATAGDDYLAISGTLTFTPGQTTKTLSVQVVGDRIPEYPEETFSLALSSPSNALVAGTAGIGTIRDEPRISSSGPIVLEGNSGSTTALLTVNLSIAYDQPVTLSYATTDETAMAGSDYVATSGTLTFAPGETTKQIPVSILGDHVAEVYADEDGFLHDLEYVGFTASNPSGNATLFGLAQLTIQDDEPRVSISPSVVVTEPATGTIDAVLTVSLSAPYDQDVIVQYATLSDNNNYPVAVAGSDYIATVGSVRPIPAGQTGRTITVPVIGDGVAEAVEYFYVGLTGVSGNATIDGGFGNVGIRDYDGTVKTWIGPASGGNSSTATNWSPSGVPTASQQVAISGESVNLSSSATVASLTLSGGASLAVASNGSRVLRSNTLFISDDSKLNLNDNAMILSSVSAADVTNYLLSGYANRTWNGNGINSSVAASTPQSSLGYALASDLFGVFPASFQGQSVNASDFLIRYTRNGDANLDGQVNSVDFTSLAMNFNQSGRRWSQGDFNYDARVNALDFNALASNYGSSLAGGSAAPAELLSEAISAQSVAAAAPGTLFSHDRIKRVEKAEVVDSFV